MKAEIKIGDMNVTLCANAGVTLIYKRLFRSDLLRDLGQIRDDELGVVDVVQKMAFVMAMMNEKTLKECLELTEIKYLEWLCEFDIAAFSHPDTIIAILNVWNGNEQTTVAGKN